jgi:hypothetical protein
MFDSYYLYICCEMIEVLTSYADNLPVKIQGSSECQTVAPSIDLLLWAHSTDLAWCWTTSKQSESFLISWLCQMILYTSPDKSIPTADVWHSSWFHIQENPRLLHNTHCEPLSCLQIVQIAFGPYQFCIICCFLHGCASSTWFRVQHDNKICLTFQLCGQCIL